MSIPRLKKTRDETPAPIPFPDEAARASSRAASFGQHVLCEFEAMSRRIDDLARELNCLGYFDEDDRPRAA